MTYSLRVKVLYKSTILIVFPDEHQTKTKTIHKISDRIRIKIQLS